MTRKIVMLIVMAFALGFVGCRSCLAPYDQCQPTFLPERGDSCMGELYRCGSILGGTDRTSNADGYCEECGGGSVQYYSANNMRAYANMGAEAGYDGSEQIEIVEERVVPNARSNAAAQVESAGSYKRSAVRNAPYAESNFSLNDDSGENY